MHVYKNIWNVFVGEVLVCKQKTHSHKAMIFIQGQGLWPLMYHFAWADQREKQGCKCDVSLKGWIQIICILEDDATLYKGKTNSLLIVGLNL